MLEAFSVLKNTEASNCLEVVLTFEQRQKSRYKCATTCGKPLGWFVQRGSALHHGDILECENNLQVRVVAAPEAVSQVDCDDALLLTRAAYHLGNRHVPLQIGLGFLRYQQDHVLDAMVQGLGLRVACQQLPFQPENGAYHGKSHGHSHGTPHSHSNNQSHGDGCALTTSSTTTSTKTSANTSATMGPVRP